MIYFAILIAVVLLIIIEYKVYKKKGAKAITYRSEFSTDTAFVGDDILMYETLENTKKLPIPYVKVNTDLPEGLEFTIIEERTDRDTRRAVGTPSIQSVFVLKGHGGIKRRWRVRCKKRGVYPAPGALVMVSDIFGIDISTKLVKSKARSEERSRSEQIVVLPTALDLSETFSTRSDMCGDVISNRCPVTDPLILGGTREYTPFDPMNKINWKSTAVHGKLMVNIEEKTVRTRFGIILNMNSHPIERDAAVPDDAAAIEQNITVAASLIDRAARQDVPIRLFVNTEPSEVFDTRLVQTDDGGSDPVGEKILASSFAQSRQDSLELLTALAYLEMKISTPAEKMFDHICDHTEYYADSQSLIVISSYIDRRMVNMHAELSKKGINVIFYLTTGRNEMLEAPENIEIYYRTH